MLIDTSVLVAIYANEAECDDFVRRIANAKRRWFSVVSYLEFVMVTKNQLWIDGFIEAAHIELVDVSKRDIEEATRGFLRYGKGRGKHAAALNFGDCIVYGTAKATGFHILFKGDDFTQTDIKSALKVGEEPQN